MPIGPWPDFASCVVANQDKSSPEGFCAWLEHKLTGAWPSQASKMPLETLSQYDKQVDAALSEALKSFHFRALETKTVKGVEVFSVGTWTDNAGEIREWTEAEIEKIAAAFEPGKVPLKIGHTTPEFNQRVATALGVPPELLTGESQGKGRISLGTVSKLVASRGKLVADFEGVPAPLADFITGGQYTSVSSEMDIYQDGIIKLSAVALLGAERPAVKNLAGLETVKIFTKKGEDGIHFYTIKRGETMADRFTKNTALKEMMVMFQEGSADALTAIAVALGLDPQTASLANVLKAIQDLKGGGMMPEVVEEQKKAFSKAQTDLAALTKTVEMQQAAIAGYEHERRVAKYQKQAETWKAIPGKAEEIGAQLAETEEKAGVTVAEMVIAQFQAANKTAEEAGVLIPLGRAKSGQGTKDPFETEVRTYAEAQKITYQQALTHFAAKDPAKVMAFAKRNGEREG